MILVDSDSPTESGEAWSLKLPYSERLHQNAPRSETEETPETMPFETQPLELDASHQATTSIGDDIFSQLTTAPVEVVPETKQETFRVLTEEEMTPEEIRKVQLDITALHHAHRLMNESEYVAPPEPYDEPFYVWKMIFQQLAPASSLIVIFTVSVIVASMGFIPGDWIIGAVLGNIVVALVCAWFAYRTHWSWQNTRFYSDPETQQTGIRRPLNRWLLLNEINLFVITADITTKDATRSDLVSFIGLNSWRVSLDTVAQTGDEFLKSLRFVRDGRRLVDMISETQRYLKSSRR